MPMIDRRAFLKATLAASAPLGFAGVARAIDPIGRTRPSHLKLSIAAYSYRDSLQPKGKTRLAAAENLAARRDILDVRSLIGLWRKRLDRSERLTGGVEEGLRLPADSADQSIDRSLGV